MVVILSAVGETLVVSGCVVVLLLVLLVIVVELVVLGQSENFTHSNEDLHLYLENVEIPPPHTSWQKMITVENDMLLANVPLDADCGIYPMHVYNMNTSS